LLLVPQALPELLLREESSLEPSMAERLSESLLLPLVVAQC
jgi:hypothetical protein